MQTLYLREIDGKLFALDFKQLVELLVHQHLAQKKAQDNKRRGLDYELRRRTADFILAQLRKSIRRISPDAIKAVLRDMKKTPHGTPENPS